MGAITPVSYFIIASCISIVALNSSQAHRLVLYPPLAGSALLSFWRLQDVSSSVTLNNILGLFVLIWLAHISNVLLVERHIILKTGDNRSWDWNQSYKIWINPRRIGTEKQVPGIRSRSTAFETQSRNEKDIRIFAERSFLAQRLLSLIIISISYYISWHILAVPRPELYQPIRLSDMAPTKQTFLRRLTSGRITTRETLIRSNLVVQWVWSCWAVFTGIHDALAIIFVSILRFDNPEDWPPLYGSLAEAYTIRRFWGKFWHRIVYRTYLDYGGLLLHGVLGIPRGSVVYGFLVNFLVFLFSGITHALVSWRLGFRCGILEDVIWFCINFVAVMFEDGLQRLLYVVSRRYGWERMRSYHAFWRTLGYVWVFCFFFWSIPKHYYPKVYCGMR